MMKKCMALVLCLVIALMFVPVLAETAEETAEETAGHDDGGKIVVLATGGTIAGVGEAKGSTTAFSTPLNMATVERRPAATAAASQ